MRRITRRVSAADARRPARAVQERKLEPFNGRVVSPLRDCKVWNTPAEKMPEKTSPALVEALVSVKEPRRVSRIEPTGSWRAPVSGTNRRPLIPGTATLANAPLAGTLTNTFPPAGAALTVLPRTGGASKVLGTPQSMLTPVSTFGRVTPDPSALTVNSSSWNGPPTSLM